MDVIPDTAKDDLPDTTGKKQWEICYEILRQYEPGKGIHWEIFGQALGVDAMDHKQRAKINQAVHRAIKELEDKDQRTAKNVRGYGFEIVKNEQRLVLAQKHQQRAAKEIDLAKRQVTNVDFGSMDSNTRRAFELTGMALQHQAQVIGRMDIRQKNLETAVEAVQAENRLNAEQLAAVTARLAALETRVDGGVAPQPAGAPQQVGYVQPQALPPGAQPGYAPNGWVHQPAQQPPPASRYPQQG